jgi:probable F420-dependent oxidoreductase
MKMKFGLAFASGVGIDAASAIEISKRAEAAGFDSVWGGEHVIMPAKIESPYPYTPDGKVPATPDTPILDPLIWLAYVAAAAPTLQLGTCILVLPQRNPVVLAKELSTLDTLTNGRVELGIGVGWMKEEFDAIGVPWERRGARTDEYVQAMRALWSNDVAEFHGDFVNFDPVSCTPRPIKGDIPIVVGGDTDAAIKRAANYADGYFPGTGDPDELKGLMQKLDAALELNNREAGSVKINAMFAQQMADPVAGAAQMAEIGVDRIMLPAFFFAGPGGLDRLSEFGENVIRKSR